MDDGAEFSQRLARLDLELLSAIYAPGYGGDPKSLLALHRACRQAYGTFDYLEIGSHLGASLQSFVADPRCTAITSIDPRPERQPDDLVGEVLYPDNSTERMLEQLARVPGADLTKLRTLEASAEQLSPEDVGGLPKLCFVDGEHTRAAALRDARFCRAVLGGSGAIAFHDRRIVCRGIGDFLSELDAEGVAYAAYPLASELFVVELGEAPRLKPHGLAARSGRAARALWKAAVPRRRPGAAITRLLVAESTARLVGRRIKRLIRAAAGRARA